MKKLTIITINKNNVNGLRRTQDSILSQIDQDFTWVIIDGASTDGSVNYLTSRADIIMSERDNGIYDAMNKGLLMSINNYVWFLNSGDELLNSRATQLVKQEVCGATIVYGDIIMEGAYTKRFWVSGNFSKYKILFGWHPPHPSFIFLNDSTGAGSQKFNEKFTISADYDFMIRKLTQKNQVIKYINSYFVKMELGGISNSNIKNIFIANTECAISWMPILKIPAFWLFVTKPLLKLLQIRLRK